MHREVAIVGARRSGKSSWLGQLGRCLQNGRSEFFQEDEEQPDDLRALRELSSAMARKTYPPRSPAGTRGMEFWLTLRAPRDGIERVKVEVSDYNGEDIDLLFQKRRGWSTAWKRRAEAAGVLLFLRDHIDSTIPFPELEAPTAPANYDPELQATYGVRPSTESHEPSPTRRDEFLKAPTEIALIETLQLMRHHRGLAPGERTSDAPRVGVALSAWDASPDKNGPRALFERAYPLLAQYLGCNWRDEDVRHFGVSASGYDFASPPPNPGAPLVAWWSAFDRVPTSPDLSLPIAWALFGEDALPSAR